MTNITCDGFCLLDNIVSCKILRKTLFPIVFFEETRILPLPSIPWLYTSYTDRQCDIFEILHNTLCCNFFYLSAISTANSSKLIHYQTYNCTGERNKEIYVMFNVLLSFASDLFWNIQQPQRSVNHIIRVSQKLRTTSICDDKYVRDNMLPSTLWEIKRHFYKTVLFSSRFNCPRWADRQDTYIQRELVLVQTRSEP